ncbi:ricin B lectin domain-containing protein, partial [Mortierella sp. GBAus27b]
FPSEKYFYIKSKASGLVLDVEHGFLRDHTKPGAYLQLNGQKLIASEKKHALLELQLWRFDNGFIINRRTGMVLDATEGSLKAGTRLIQWTRRTTDNDNQQWTVSNGFIHLKNNPNMVLDVDGDGTRDGARIALGERKEKKNLDQRCKWWTVYMFSISLVERI